MKHIIINIALVLAIAGGIPLLPVVLILWLKWGLWAAEFWVAWCSGFLIGAGVAFLYAWIMMWKEAL